MLSLVAERHLLNIDRNFEDQSGPDGRWKPLSKHYREWKERQPRAIQKILQFSGLMRAGVNKQVGADGKSIRVGSDKIYSPKHERTRPFLRPTDQQIEQFGEIAADYIANL